MPDKDLIVFDLDGTLAPSKSGLDPDMADLMRRLLRQKKVAVVSGGNFKQFEKQFISSLNALPAELINLLLLPTTGASLYVWNEHEKWIEKYSEKLMPEEKEKIIGALTHVMESPLYETPKNIFGTIVEDRGTQITFSGVGQEAPISVKETWDPDHKKRDALIEALKKEIPEYDIHMGGMTSIDITHIGINKEYAMHKLKEFTDLPFERMLFVGDALYAGGNDAPVKATGTECIQVKDPEATKTLLRSWLV